MAIRFSTPLHPGEILREEFLVPLNLTPGKLAKAIGVPRTRIERIAKEEIGVTADTALRLARYFDTTPDLWMNLQQAYEIAIESVALKVALEAIEPRASNDNETNLEAYA